MATLLPERLVTLSCGDPSPCRSVPKNLSRLINSRYLSSGSDGSYAAPLDPDQFDAAVGCLSRLLEEVGVPGEQGAEILLRFRFGRTLCRGAHFGRERDPTLLIGAFGRDRYVRVDLLTESHHRIVGMKGDRLPPRDRPIRHDQTCGRPAAL